ncbi:MAG: undecaprenyldiphospho-muramoylpentapeptide beta-N-acetylglucosaminyltransferase [Clostridia bacterium]|nr:undecaprenyldiphospho-muramoylpentapeptide beta-N-acetylglucosaminyltransferase [Clostridia bacterium]
MKIVLTGGGTAGHIMPHLAMMDDFKKHFKEIVYIGSENGMEKDIIKKQNDIKYYGITTTKFVRKKILRNLLIPFKLLKGIHQSKKILKQEKPNVIFSKGGYVSLPVVISAKKLKIPVIAHESDLKMGLANRLAKNKAKVICTTFERTAKEIKGKGVWTGSPMRKNLQIDKNTAKQKLDINSQKPVLLITGGSLGSQFINKKIREDIQNITKKYYVIHLCGKGNIDENLKNIKNYRQIDFTLNMGTILSAADLVVSRAGSNTIFELAVLKKPMLLIPLPKGNSRGDQVDNAKYFNSQGYVNFVEESQLIDNSILQYIDKTFDNKETLIQSLNKANIQPGNKKILEIILNNSRM